MRRETSVNHKYVFIVNVDLSLCVDEESLGHYFKTH